MKSAYEILTEAAHANGESGNIAAQSSLQLASWLVSYSGLNSLIDCAEMLRYEAEKRQRCGLITTAIALNHASVLLLLNQQ